MSLPPATIEFAHRMFSAARNGDASALVPAINAGLPPNLTNPEGNTLLMLAAYAGHHDLARELISLGADPNRLNDRGQSIVAGAVFKGHGDTVKVLVEAGADPRAGRPTAVEVAYMFGRKDLMDVLGAREGDVSEDVPRPVTEFS
ncbi:ankyrin [Desarmillaria ectypa]|nr:ankyrin [Desarmillaria ectypa]